jgi:Sec-independent protein secretion pathway component TatC
MTSPDKLRNGILIVAIAAAVVTPTPNAKAMLIFMIPMIALFIVSVIVVAFKS